MEALFLEVSNLDWQVPLIEAPFAEGQQAATDVCQSDTEPASGKKQAA